MNPMQKYPHIIELVDCILNMFVFIFLWPIKFSSSTPQLSKQIISILLQYKGIQCVPTSADSFIPLGKLSVE